MPRLSISASLALAAGLLSASLALAQTAPTRIRGTVESLNGDMLVVKTKAGTDTVKLAPDWAAGGIDKASLTDIKPGTFVGTAALPRGDTLRAIEVVVFPPGVKGRDGHFAWDLLPESTMTNATVADTVTGADGTSLKMTYQGGEKTVVVAPETIIVTIVKAEKADVKPGAPVFISADKAADGSLTASRVTVGNHGIAPPM